VMRPPLEPLPPRRSADPDPDGALFVMPTSTVGQPGPVAVWITASGWAAAARRRYGRSWIVTPHGVISPEEALATATRPSLRSKERPGWRRHVPRIVATARKDLVRTVAARRFKDAALQGPWMSAGIAFVWQRHELFHTAGFRAARSLGCPLILFVDAPIVWEEASWGVRRPGWGALLEAVGERPQLRSADLVACVSEEVAEQVVARGAPEERVLVTPCSVDHELFNPDVSGLAVRKRLGLDGAFVVGWVGSFRRFHGVEAAVRAAARLQDSVPELTLLLVGDGLERPRMERLARELGLRRVVFTGTVPYEEMPAHIGAMDVALVLDAGDLGFHYSPLKLKEYMACGKPVIGPRVGQVARTMTDGVDALLVEQGDLQALARAIQGLHRDPDLRRALGRAARDRISLEGSWDLQLERALAALDRRAAVVPSAREGST